ncbi:hypothetical protein V6Z12_A12G074000 [Gossypium hirsutum]
MASEVISRDSGSHQQSANDDLSYMLKLSHPLHQGVILPQPRLTNWINSGIQIQGLRIMSLMICLIYLLMLII